MMKKYLLTILLISFSFIISSNAQEYSFDWVNLWDDGRSVLSDHMAVDDEHNLLIAGRLFSNETDFDPGPNEHIVFTTGEDKGHITKFDTYGNFQWVQVFESDYMGVAAFRGVLFTDIKTTTTGDVYATGHFIGTLTYTDASGPQTITASGSTDGFIVKISSEGDLLWLRTYGDAYDTQVRAVTITDSGDIYFTGYFAENIQFDPNGITEYSEYYDLFIMKLNADDEFQWLYRTEFTGLVPVLEPYSIEGNDDNGVVVTGYYRELDGNDLDFDPGAGTTWLPGTGGHNTFVLKVTNDGIFEWANSYNTTGTDIGMDVHMNDAGEILMSARMGVGTIDPDPTNTGEEITATNGGAYYLLKVDSDGNFIWIDKFEAGQFTSDSSIRLRIAVDTDENIYLQGTFEGSLDLDPGPGTFIIQKVAGATNDAYLVKLNPDGEFISGQGLGTTWSDIGLGLVSDSFGNVYGSHRGGGDEPPLFGDIPVTAIGNGSTYFYKITGCGNEMVHQLDNVTLYADASNATYQWVDCNNGNAPLPGETNRTFIASESGSYALQATTYNCVDTSECYVIEILNIENNVSQQDIVVYPNPTTDQIYIQGEFGTLKVVDVLGRTLLQSTNSEVNISHLPTGPYFVVLIHGGTHSYHKIIKQ